MNRIFHAYSFPHEQDRALTRVVIDWPRLEAVVSDQADPIEIAKRLVAEHFSIQADLVQVSLRQIIAGDSATHETP